MKYNCGFEIYAILLEIVILAYIHVQYKKNADENRKFTYFISAIFVATILDVLTSELINYFPQIDTRINMALNALYYLAAINVGYTFYVYVDHCTRNREKKYHFSNLVINSIVLLAMVISLAFNFPYHFLFGFEPGGTFVRGPLNWLLIAVIFYYIINSGALLFLHRKQYSRGQFYSILLFIVLEISGTLIQLLLLPEYLIIYALGAIGSLVVLFSLESPDIYEITSLKAELKKERDQVVVANTAKQAFLANLAHEIRTPVNGILGMNTMILKEEKNTQILEYAHNIERSGKSLLGLVNDVLDLSKLDSGSLELASARYNLANLMGDCYNQISDLAEAKNLKLNFENDEFIPLYLVGDELRIRQIINNLLYNAVKYSHEGTISLSVGFQLVDDTSLILKIFVKDTGIGIREDNLTRIFNKYESVEDIKNSRIGSSGLGLRLTQQLVKYMGGSISAESVYGEGAVFCVSIPQGRTPSEDMGNFWDSYVASKKEYSIEADSFIAPNASILVVDDVFMNVNVIRGLLKHTKIKIDYVASGDEALDILSVKRYDLVLMDHLMPIMDGVETLSKLRRMADNPNEKTPIIALTANALVGAREFYLSLGFDEYLHEPIQEIDLCNMLIAFLPPALIKWRKGSAPGLKSITVIAGRSENGEESLSDYSEGENLDCCLTEADAETNLEEVLEPDETVEELAKVKSASEQIIEQMSFLDVQSGLLFCGGAENLYVEMLRDFVRKDCREKLEGHYKAEDWKAYWDVVHRLRTSSKTIGAQRLYEEAKEMEKASGEENVEYILLYHGRLSEHYGQLLDMMGKVFGM